MTKRISDSLSNSKTLQIIGKYVIIITKNADNNSQKISVLKSKLEKKLERKSSLFCGLIVNG